MGNFSEFIQRWKHKAAGRPEAGDYIDVKPEPPDYVAPRKPPSVQGWWLHRLRPGARREEQVAALQAGYTELVDLIRSIRQHLEHQNANQEQQTEVLSIIRQQMESGVQRDQQVVENLGRFNQALASLDETNRNSLKSMAGLAEHSRASQELLRSLLDRSEKRLIAVTVVLGLLIVVAVGSALYLTFLRGPIVAGGLPRPALPAMAATGGAEPPADAEAFSDEAGGLPDAGDPGPALIPPETGYR